MSFAAWLTVGVTAAAVIAMAREWLEPPLALGGALGLLLIGGVITPAEGLAGFSNPAVATVALLLVIAFSMVVLGLLPNTMSAPGGNPSGGVTRGSGRGVPYGPHAPQLTITATMSFTLTKQSPVRSPLCRLPSVCQSR